MEFNVESNKGTIEYRDNIMKCVEHLKALEINDPIYKSIKYSKKQKNIKSEFDYDYISSTKKDKEFVLWEQIITACEYEDSDYLLSFIENKNKFLKILDFLCECDKILVSKMPNVEYQNHIYHLSWKNFLNHKELSDYINQENVSNVIVTTFFIDETGININLSSVNKV